MFTFSQKGQCVECVREGLVCQYDTNCCGDLQCDKEGDYVTNGVCRPARGTGEQCWENSQCASGSCSDSIFIASGTCREGWVHCLGTIQSRFISKPQEPAEKDDVIASRTRVLFQYPVRHPVVRSRKISKPRDFVFRNVRSHWNLTGTSAALMPMCLSNFRSMRRFKTTNLAVRDFTRSYDKTSYQILERGPGNVSIYKNSLSSYRDSHQEGKMALEPSNHHIENPFPGKVAPLC